MCLFGERSLVTRNENTLKILVNFRIHFFTDGVSQYGFMGKLGCRLIYMIFSSNRSF